MPIHTGFSCISYVNILLIALYLRSVQPVPDEYCFKKFNRSDCGVPKIPVYHYFIPGSRCEVVYWKGCPTGNMFESFYQCHHHCISRLVDSTATEVPQGSVQLEKKEEKNENRCDVDLVTKNCSLVEELVYTFDRNQQACVKKAYYGCDTGNKFSEKHLCEKTCAAGDWVNKVEGLSIKELKKMSELLENVKEPENEIEHVVETPENEEENVEENEEQKSPEEDEDNEMEHFTLPDTDINGDSEVMLQNIYKNRCDVDLVTKNCSLVEELVYTFDIKQQGCVKKAYYGCDTGNKFSDKLLCEKTCADGDWINKIEELSVNELEKMYELLEKVKEPENEIEHVVEQVSEREEIAAWALEQRTLPPDRDHEGDIFRLRKELSNTIIKEKSEKKYHASEI